MQLAFVAKNSASLPAVEAVFLAQGFIVSDHPEFVIVIGGDGTLLRAENQYPGVPKCLIKDSAVGNLYMEHSAEEFAAALRTKRFTVDERSCLEAAVQDKTLRAANDVIIRNKHLTQAIRFFVSINGERITQELIGDGLVIATPLGSSAYYNSLTRSTFAEGIGIAFNNIHNTQNLGPQVTEHCNIVVNITRGPADLGVDNNPDHVELVSGDAVRISKSMTPLRIVQLRNL